MGCSTLLLASAVSTLGGLVFGYELGIISVGGCLIDRHGRRNAILLSNILILTGSLVLLISSYPVLVVGRITVGFAMCISSMSCCIFVSEMVPTNRRGFLVTLYEAGITVGILAAYAINYLLSQSRRGWRWMFGLAVVPTLVQLVSIRFLPSSTKDSVSCNLMNPTETSETEDSKVSCSTRSVQYDSRSLFQSKDNMRTRTMIGLGLVLFQQFSGQPNVLFYASTIFHSVGFQSNASAVLASMGLGLVKVIATLTSMVFSDRVGRRPLLIGGCSIMALCLVTIGLLSGPSLMNAKRLCDSEEFSVNTTDLPQFPAGHRSVVDTPLDESHRLLHNNTQVGGKPLDPGPESSSIMVNWVILLCMMAVVSAYSIGFGPMTWILLSEIFPAAVRGRAFAFTSCFNWAANLLVTCTFLNVIETIGLSKVFLLYGLTAMAAGIFFYFLLPETKGKTLEEIDQELRLNRFHPSERCCGCVSRRHSSPQYQRVHCQVSTSG
ncbi:solute carrier family 2, facilitated glucose transporter member 10 isoform X2 [Trachinotus anak]|uniref:solute carrier family 2, facilitated glucose transporter member 10 isoform X2 n=1 Tax=Trachinotus anak TaxID=443729 RepID=UPI0039F209D5